LYGKSIQIFRFTAGKAGAAAVVTGEAGAATATDEVDKRIINIVPEHFNA